MNIITIGKERQGGEKTYTSPKVTDPESNPIALEVTFASSQPKWLTIVISADDFTIAVNQDEVRADSVIDLRISISDRINSPQTFEVPVLVKLVSLDSLFPSGSNSFENFTINDNKTAENIKL